MAESNTVQNPPLFVVTSPTLQFDPTADLAASNTSSDEVNNDNVFSPLLDAQLEANAQLIEGNPVLVEGLLSLNTPILTFFNETLPDENENPDPDNGGVEVDINGLTAEQIQALSTLQADLALIEDGNGLTAPLPLAASSTTLDLSVAAAADAIGDEPVTPAENTSDTILLTDAQIEQSANIIAPFANQPLTPTVISELQAQLAANQINVSLTMNNIFMIMGYVAAMQQSNVRVNDAAVKPPAQEMVAPVAAISEVSVENGTLL